MYYDMRDLYQQRMEVRARNGQSNFACDFDFHVNSQVSLTCHKTVTCDRRLYFPSEEGMLWIFSP
jgi:hypothetical protein